MKLNFAVLALLVTAGTAVANVYPQQVDFSGVTRTVDITLQDPLGAGGLTPNSLHLGGVNGVTFQFDPQGNFDLQGKPITTASADRSGIFGSTTGALNLYFDNPAVGLRFDFSVAGVLTTATGTVDLFASNSDFVSFNGTQTLENINGHVDYAAITPFNSVTLFPSSAGTTFTISSIQFDSTVAPEPASFLLPMGMGMLALGFARRFSKRRS